METIHAIFENGVFRPVVPVRLPEHCEVEFEPRVVKERPKQNLQSIFAILDERYDTGEPDLAARHNEHQP
jgi:predicted DNA-binding antitoxin AbrB/MazE fold protein